MSSHIKKRARSLPDALRKELVLARRSRRWSQAELGRRAGLPQMHISGIETGKIVPRFDTLLDLVRILERDMLLIPRELVPAVQALVQDHRARAAGQEERPLYTSEGDDEEDKEP